MIKRLPKSGWVAICDQCGQDVFERGGTEKMKKEEQILIGEAEKQLYFSCTKCGWTEKLKTEELKTLCEKIGGHCWIEITPNEVYLSNPPEYPQRIRKCKHCGRKQIEKTTPPVWVDIEKEGEK